MMPRRTFLVCFTAILLIFQAGPLKALEGGLPTSIQKLVGEDALYFIDFLVFHRVAQAELRFSATDQPGVFRAVLVGRTLGVVSWLSGERTQTYMSLMELSSDGSLRTVEHTARIVKRRWGRWQDRLRHYRYDYEHGKILDEKTREGVPRELMEYDIPEGLHPVDMLTAFYNLRIGVYGSLERGSRLLIPTYTRGEFTKIEVRVLTHEQQAKQNNFPAQGLLLQVTIDPEIFDTRSGNLYVWFNDAGVPGRGIVEDLIGAGDVLGYLDREGI
jgi:hypothetical protein